MKSEDPLISAEATLSIPFHDVDPAQIVWHGHYAKYLEVARGKLLDKIDYNYPQMSESGYFWPVIDMSLRYIAPIRFQQKIVVTAVLKEWEIRLRIDYVITDAETGKRLTKASTTQAAVNISTGVMLLASPAVFVKKVVEKTCAT
jgi:acyl-CoA thioester hydrolase